MNWNRIAAEIADRSARHERLARRVRLRNDGMRYLTARVDRMAAGRAGLNAAEIQDALRVWVDGQQVGPCWKRGPHAAGRSRRRNRPPLTRFHAPCRWSRPKAGRSNFRRSPRSRPRMAPQVIQ